MASDKKVFITKTLLNDINAFIDTHYEFKCNSRYKGFFGKIRAHADRAEYEQQDHYSPREIYAVVPEPAGISYYSEKFYSDPPSKEQREAEEQKKKQIEQKNEALRKKAFADFLEESFSSTLIKLIESKNKDAVNIYKQANIDRKLFSKIRSDKGYMPSKKTALAFAIALELSIEETNDLLKRAGFTLSRSLLFDVIIEYFITRQNYDIYEINDVLFRYKQPILGE